MDRSGSGWLVVANGDGDGVDIGGPRVVVGGRDLAGVSESGVGIVSFCFMGFEARREG